MRGYERQADFDAASGADEEQRERFVQPSMTCPRCGKAYEDFDGVGVLYCSPPDGCGYCRHASRSDGACDYCGQRRLGERP